MPERKALQGLKIEDADKGLVSAVFSTFNVKDADGDVTMPDAFEDGAPVRISAYGHASHGTALPVGKGAIRVTETEAVLDGQFFLSTQAGRDTFETVKEMADLQEWSYGYAILDASKGDFEGEQVQFLRKLKVDEVSPVLLGAGVNTRTLAVKGAEDEPEDGLKFMDEADHALGSVEALVHRAQALGSLRAEKEEKEGRVFSAANRERLFSLLGALKEADAAVETLLTESDPDKLAEAFLREEARVEQRRAAI